MPKKDIPQISKATPLAAYNVRIEWTNGIVSVINIEEWLNKSEWFVPVLNSKQVWESLTSSEWGWAIEWQGCEMEIPTTTLWRIDLEQQRKAMPQADFVHWIERHKLTLEQTADLLGISRRMVAYYKNGERIIPRTVMLACKGAELEMQETPNSH